MHFSKSLIFCALLVNAPVLRADEQAAMRALLDRAINAAGGEANLAKLNAVTFTMKTQFVRIDNADIVISGTWTLRGLDCYRFEGQMGSAQKSDVVIVLNKGKAWSKVGEQVQDVPALAVVLVKKLILPLRSIQLLTPLKNNDVKLSQGGEIEVGKRTLAMIKVSHPEQGNWTLFLDKETGLPIKAELSFPNEALQPIHFECGFHDYKDLSGGKSFTKLMFKGDLRDLKKDELTIELADFKTHERLEESLFARPG